MGLWPVVFFDFILRSEGAYYTSPGRSPGTGSKPPFFSPERAYWTARCYPVSTPFQGWKMGLASFPRASPWAGIVRTFGAQIRSRSAITGGQTHRWGWATKRGKPHAESWVAAGEGQHAWPLTSALKAIARQARWTAYNAKQRRWISREIHGIISHNAASRYNGNILARKESLDKR